MVIAILLAGVAVGAFGQTLSAEENTWRRATQMLNVKWIAQGTMPNTASSSGYFKGVTYTGVPYSQAKENDKFIGFDVSLTTFVTAVNNPYSVLYTEDTDSARTKSAYGAVYHGTTAGLYMGLDCSGFVAYSLGLPFPWKTAQYAYLADEGIMKWIADYNTSGAAQLVQPMDVEWKSGHVRLITSVTRDDSGNVTNIRISEATSSRSISTNRTAISREFTADEFETLLKNDEGIVYRYSNLSQNNAYSRSAVVAAEGESAVDYDFNDDICTYRGDSCSFRFGEQIVINYNLKTVGSWTSMQLFDDNDNLISTISIDKDSHSADVTQLIPTYGKYKARMTDGTNNSRFTYFEVINTNVSQTQNSSTSYTLRFSSANATPVYFQYCWSTTGANRGSYEFSSADIANGYVTVNPSTIMQNQMGKTYNFSTTYVKVHFQGAYGRVTSEPFLLSDGCESSALYGRPLGAFYAGLNENGSRYDAVPRIVVPKDVDFAVPNLSENAAFGNYWTYNDENGAHQTDENVTPEDLNLSVSAEASGTELTAPVVYAAGNSYTNGGVINVVDTAFASGTTMYWSANHALWGTSSFRHFTKYYSFNTSDADDYWTSAYASDYQNVQIRGFMEYFRSPLKPYKMSKANVVLFLKDTQSIADTGLKLEICQAESNADGTLSSWQSAPLATWSATADDLKKIVSSSANSGTYYLLQFSGDEMTVSSPIVLRLLLASDADNQTAFAVCHSANPDDFTDKDQSAFLIANVTSASETTETWLSAYKTFKYDVDNDGQKETTYNRSFCFYINAKYDDSTTGIANLSHDSNAFCSGNTYNVMGQRVKQDAKGLVIRNRKIILNR